MSRLRLTLDVARWEFSRFFKPRDQVKSMLLVFALATCGFFGMRFVGRSLAVDTGGDPRNIRIGVIQANPSNELVPVTTSSRLQFIPRLLGDDDVLRDEVTHGRLDGILLVGRGRGAEVVARGEPPWLEEVSFALARARLIRALEQLGVEDSQTAVLTTPFPVDLIPLTTITGPAADNGASLLAAGLLIATSMVGVFLGTAHLFISITGEKKVRFTEQVISIVSAQTLIDGKILGLAAFSLATLLTGSIGFFMFVALANLVGLSLPLPFPSLASVDFGLLFLLVTLALLGFLFWLAFFAAIAATISDPNTSSRGAFIFFPLFPMAFAFMALKFPDATIMKVLSIIPGTSPAVLSARLVVGNVSSVETVLALVLLVLGVGLLRHVAGRIYSVAMLMYGKEPSLREVLRWIKVS